MRSQLWWTATGWSSVWTPLTHAQTPFDWGQVQEWMLFFFVEPNDCLDFLAFCLPPLLSTPFAPTVRLSVVSFCPLDFCSYFSVCRQVSEACPHLQNPTRRWGVSGSAGTEVTHAHFLVHATATAGRQACFCWLWAPSCTHTNSSLFVSCSQQLWSPHHHQPYSHTDTHTTAWCFRPCCHITDIFVITVWFKKKFFCRQGGGCWCLDIRGKKPNFASWSSMCSPAKFITAVLPDSNYFKSAALHLLTQH